METTADQVRMENISLRTLIVLAYRVLQGERVEGPNWMDSATFDIIAKPPAGYRPAEDTAALFRNLLAERFKLKVHTEATSVSAFALVVSKGGFKLSPSEGSEGMLTYRPGRMEGKHRTIAEFARFLSSAVGQQVVDETRLTGFYDIELSWSPFRPGDLESEAALLTALREQLGLQLEQRKVPARNIIVDEVEREPTEN
jgi:uncharacterized protein (TIGR03435 family)